MRKMLPQDLKALSFSLRRLGKDGSWEAAANLALLALDDDIELDSWPESDRLELAEVVVDVGIQARRMKAPIAGRSAGQWCALAYRLAGHISSQGPDFDAIRNHVHYWHAVTQLEGTSELAGAEEATKTLCQLLPAYPVEDADTAARRAFHLSRIARGHERCAELESDLERCRDHIRQALTFHEETEAIIRSIGWTESVEYATLLQRRALTMRVALWVERAAGTGGSAAQAHAVVGVLHQSLELFMSLHQIRVRDVNYVVRRLAMSLMDAGDYEAALERASEATLANRPSGGTMSGPVAVSIDVVAIAVAAAAAGWGGEGRHGHYTRLRELLSASGHIHREVGSKRELALLDFDMTLARTLCDRYPSRVFDPRGNAKVLQDMLDLISIHSGPHAADTLHRRNLMALLVARKSQTPTGGGS